MAFAVLKFRRGTTPTTTLSEPYYNTDRDTLQIGNGGSSITLARLGINTGSIEFSGDITADNITATGDLTIGGNLFLGDNIADNIVITGELSSSIIPNDDNEFDLGSTSKRWKNIYAASATIDSITLNGSGIVSSSAQISDYNTFLEINGDNVFSGSSQVNADSITNFDSNVKDKMNADDVISGSSQLTTEFDTRYLNTNGDSVISSSAQLTTEFDTRYLNTNGDSVVSSSAQISNYNTFLEINGDSVVSSSAQISNYNTFLEIDGMGVFSGSSQVNANTITNFDSNVKDKMNADGVISSSAQIEGDFLEVNGDNVVSSSEQVDFLQLNNLPNGIISGSDQVNSYIVGTTYSQSVDTRLDTLETDSHTHSNKSQLDTINQNLSTTSDVTFNDGDFTGDVSITGNLSVLGTATEIQTSELRVEDKLITVASGSADSAAADGAGLEIDGANKSLKWEHGTQQFVLDAKVSSSVGFKGDGSELTGINAGAGITFDGTSIVSSSQQISDYNTFLEINGDSVVSGSQQVIDLLPVGTVSGSLQIDHNQTTNYTASRHIDHSTITVGSGKGLTGGGTIDVSRSITLDTGSTHFSDGVVEVLPSGTVSGSSQVTITESQISDLDKYTDSDTLSYINSIDVHSGSYLGTATTSDLSEGVNLYYTNTRVTNQINDLGVISGSTFSSPSQGTVRATINGTQTDVDTGLQSVDSPTFQGVTLTNLSSLGAGNVTALMSGSGGVVGVRSLGTAAFFNVSASVGNDPNSIPTNAAVDAALVAAGAGDITAVNDTSLYSSANTGIKHTTQGTETSGEYGQQGNIVLAIDTGSSHFQEGVELYSSTLPSGVVSGSAQITAFGFISESFSTDGTDIVSGSVLRTLDGTGVVSGSVLRPNGDGVVSGSVLRTLDGTGVLSGSIETNLPSGVVSGSSQVSLDGDVTGGANANTVEKVQGVSLTSGEATQLANINSNTISEVQWGYVGNLNQNLRTSDNVTFADGLYSGDVTISGNLTVQGTATEIQVSELRIEDKRITVASGSADSLAANGAGIEIAGANQSITWDHGGTRFSISAATRVMGDLTADGDVVAYSSSDRKLKDNIQPISNPLEKINQISGNSFEWNEEKQNIYKGKDYGVIAQEIEEILPELVQTRQDGYKAVKYDKLVSLLIEGIKELNKEVTSLKKKIGES